MQRFESVEVSPGLRRALVARLAVRHAEQPFSPHDPREALRRSADELTELGLEAAWFRGTLSVAAAEVDHVWLAVRQRSGRGATWVLDTAFPLHLRRFVDALPGYVAGLTSRQDLTEIARDATIDDRVLGVLPDRVVYRGSPRWGDRGGAPEDARSAERAVAAN